MDISEANKVLIEKRQKLQQERENILASVKSLIVTDVEAARVEALKIKDTIHASELRNIFEENKPNEKCPDCNQDLNFFMTGDYKYQSSCINCENIKTLLLEEENNKKQIKHINQRYISCIDSHLERQGVSKRFLNARLTDFPVSWQSFALSKEGLFLTGNRGVGKTYFASAIMRAVLEELFNDMNNFQDSQFQGYMPIFIQAPELILLLKKTFKQDSEYDESDILERYTNPSLLIIDDLGVEKSSEWALQNLYIIIDRRYRNEQRTIFTSNLTLDEIAQKFDDRIASRIAGMCTVQTLKGKDRRIKQ